MSAIIRLQAADSAEHMMEEPGAPVPERVNILVVDDLPEKLLVYETILADLDQNLVLAGSGDEALKLILKQEFAVILMDVNMPGLDGFETAALIRQRKRSARTPIIFLTAFMDELHAAQGYASGAVDYLLTPVVPQILKAKVRVFIELFQMRQQAASQAEEQARRMSAEEADERKDEFLGMLAHELRNPLGPIRNAVQLLQIIGSKESRVIQLHDIIDRQVSHMARLIDDLLDSTRLARGQILLRKEPCDLARIARQTVEDYRAIFEASGLQLDIDVSDRPVFVEGDPTRLTQVIGNLLHNAHKFTDPGGSVTICLEQAIDGRMAFITVQDTGIGIDPAMTPYIFDVFRQAEQGLDRNRGGLGLGLTLVKGLIELHNGNVWVNSGGLGQGTTFTVRLPAIARQAIDSTDSPAAPAANDRRCRVLIIEDNKDTAESARLLLDLDGYDVRTAHSGTEGLESARSFLPQVILCDIGLPGMDGYQVVRLIRQDPALSTAYVVALTGYGRDEDQRQAREAGFNLHLTKPIDNNALRRALAHLPARKQVSVA